MEMRTFDNSIRRNSLCAAFAALLLVLAFSLSAAGDRAPVEAAFGDDCEALLVREIGRAEKDIVVAIYSITRRNITAALAEAVERGVKVRLKYDAGSAADTDDMKSAIRYLRKQGVKCEAIAMSDAYGKMHHKFTVIDGKRVLTGSYNYTSSATSANDENIVLIESPDIAKEFSTEFERIKSK